ncbi:arsenate reductase/protein-tyrosine-phosphatase family protein [Microbacterium allomyrinae]|uniref:Low molecular weight phosphatase family protein n=1 Tax=Microbacterium allomyrinae TaxID=2830666 RepID=A0A9X1LYH2_9MICO|nr:low molecular weight phosphatase family protein [Microbacterium allomyrinae]MCC2034068.1 low molecular weight phosphatase family protein [Microbacterium allomyrinae]
MFEILTVCTGNICRSPLAAQLLQSRLADFAPRVLSAGTRGLTDTPMTAEAAHLAAHYGVAADLSSAHRSRWLREGDLDSPDLILAMTREHRREVAELAPARLRSTFTIREFARLAEGLSDDEIRAHADSAGADAAARVRAVAGAVGARRGMVEPVADPADDDVVDPYRRSWETYVRSADQLVPAVDGVVRTLRVALATT